MKQELSRFMARTPHEEDDIWVELIVYQDFIEVETVGGHKLPTVPGLKSLETESGDRFKRISKGHYQHLDSGASFISHDPDAP